MIYSIKQVMGITAKGIVEKIIERECTRMAEDFSKTSGSYSVADEALMNSSEYDEARKKIKRITI